jgi:hypothetical protein
MSLASTSADEVLAKLVPEKLPNVRKLDRSDDESEEPF